MPIDAVELRDKLGQALSPYLGTYTYPNGYTRSAISVGNPANNLQVEGLELVIPFFPNSKGGRWLTDTVEHTDVWTIYLVKREGATAEDFINAGNRLKTIFARCETQYIPQNETIGTYEQLVVKFRNIDSYQSYQIN